MGTLNKKQKQVLLSGILGDGSIIYNGRMTFNSIHKEYLKYKQLLLENISSDIVTTINKGFKRNEIHRMTSRANNYGKNLNNYTLKQILSELDELGIVLWFYDDITLHKTKYFYNLCTHSFTKEEHEEEIIPFLQKIGINAKIRKEVKKDGRVFYYTEISKHSGAFEVSKLLMKYPLKCFEYKLWDNEEFHYYKLANEHDEFKNMSGWQRPHFLRKIKRGLIKS